jgi:hypothetical protein
VRCSSAAHEPDVRGGLCRSLPGLVAWTARPTSRVGPLIAVDGLAWFLRTLWAPAVFLVRGPARAPAGVLPEREALVARRPRRRRHRPRAYAGQRAIASGQPGGRESGPARSASISGRSNFIRTACSLAGSHQGRTAMQRAAKSDYARGQQDRTTTRNPVWVDPLLTFMVRRGSTVRVRQRASQNTSKWRVLLSHRGTTEFFRTAQTCPQDLSPSS